MKTTKSFSKAFCFLVFFVVLLAPLLSSKVTAQTETSTPTIPVENCVIGYEKIAGQANAVIGGATGNSTTGQLPSGEVIDPSWINTAANLIGDPDNAINSVDLLIVDDFSSVKSHGKFVYDVTLQLWSSLPIQYREKIKIEEVDIGSGYITSTFVVNTLNEFMSRNLDLRSDRNFMVWNLSFGLIPCQDPTLDFDMQKFVSENEELISNQKPPLTLIEYLSLGGEDGKEKAKKLVRNVDTTALDPLQVAIKDFYQKYGSDSRLFPIAAAGNLELSDALYPAAWPQIVGVGASYYKASIAKGEVADWNRGEVRVPGQWYLTSRQGATYIAGTSFASPGFSLLMAAYLSNTTTPCRFMDMINPQQQIFDNPTFDVTAAKYFCGNTAISSGG